jgi:glycosyltransferase involved in cell wall biosynthesis
MQLGYNLVGLPLLLRSMLGKHVDFIYERYSLFNFSGVIAARVFGVPLILEVNSPLALEQLRDKDIQLDRLSRWTERWICSRATRVIVVSTPLARIMRQAGVPAAKLEVMVNGVNLENFQSAPGSEELRRSLGIDGQTVIGFVGWFRRWHGLEALLEAFAKSGLAGCAKVMLIGDGQAMPELRRYVKEHSMDADVIFTGPLPHAHVPRYLDLIDIAVQPAANEYCCPMKILEYMALGKSIVAPRQENIKDLLREGEDAELFTPGEVQSLSETLRKLVQDRSRMDDMGRRARAAITERRFLWSENAARVVAMVQGVR